MSGAVKMQFKNESGAWSSLEVFSNTKAWTLSSGDGAKQVFVRVTDIQGTLSDGTDVITGLVNTIIPPSVTIEAYTDSGAGTPIPSSTYQTDKTPFFRWLVPTYNTSYEGFSFALDDAPNDLIGIFTGTLIRNGIEVSKGSGMGFNIASGYFYCNNDLREEAASNITLDNGGALDRIDIIYINGIDANVYVANGDENISPLPPDTPEESIALARAYVPAGAVDNSVVTLTDLRQFYIELSKFLAEPLSIGQHILNVKGRCVNGLWSDIATFNIWVADDSPTIGEIKCYTDGTKLVELANGLYQTADNTPYFEWDAAPTEPGPIRYYYTEDGTEPDIGDSFLVVNNYTPGVYLDGITVLKVRAYDVTTGYWGETKSFIFIYGTQVFTDDTAIICGNTILRQSLKEVHVKEISWDFNSARVCRFFLPVDFDSTLPFSEGETICVVYGATNETLLSGRITQIERTIDIGEEGVIYNCSGPRQDLSEEYAYIIDENYGETAQITFNDVPLSTAIDTIVSKFPMIVKNIESYPVGANISDEYIGQTVSSILDSIYSKTKYGWYMRPNGSLVSIDLTAINPGQAKFGIYGTTVNAISPQYNVMTANLQFDITNRYNKCIIEGAKKLERIMVNASCTLPGSLVNQLDEESRDDYNRFKIYHIDSKWPVVKIIETFVSYYRVKAMFFIPIVLGSEITAWSGVFLKTEICQDNKIIKTEKEQIQKTTEDTSGLSNDHYLPGVKQKSQTSLIEEQGSLGTYNTIRFSREMYNFWPRGATNSTLGYTVDAGIASEQTRRECANVGADILIETIPLKVEVIVSGTASGISKTLRIVNTSFKYSEDPEDLVDDTLRMTEYATDLLEKYKDIKVNGSITLDTIDLDWDLDKTVNLINTAQGSWTTLNAKVIGIKYDFDMNTTTLEITSEYLK